MSVFDRNVRNNSYSNFSIPAPRDSEWKHLENLAVKEFGEWSRTFVQAVATVAANHKISAFDDAETVIYYHW
jgi:hypothetical protein